MAPDRRILYIVFAVVLVLVAALLFWPQVREELAPRPTAAWVAIQPEGSDEAVVGTLELPAGTPFRLHAVLEATRRDGSKMFYTEAPALRFPDGPVATQALRPWDRRQEIKVLWFTVEGAVPYLELKPADTLDRFRMTEFLRPDWPQTWSIPGSLDPANDDSLVRSGARADNPFGTQRFSVRIELYGSENRYVPQERFSSWGADQVRAQGRRFPAVIATLPGAIGPVSALFGLTQIDPPRAPEKKDAALEREIGELTRQHIAFSRLTAIETILEAAGKEIEQLDWRLVSLDGGVRWGDGSVEAATGAPRPAMGNLLRVGDRVVVLYRDEGKPEVLDRQDLCFDFAHGATVRPLGDVFVGGGEIQWASLTGGTGS